MFFFTSEGDRVEVDREAVEQAAGVARVEIGAQNEAELLDGSRIFAGKVRPEPDADGRTPEVVGRDDAAHLRPVVQASQQRRRREHVVQLFPSCSFFHRSFVPNDISNVLRWKPCTFRWIRAASFTNTDELARLRSSEMVSLTMSNSPSTILASPIGNRLETMKEKTVNVIGRCGWRRVERRTAISAHLVSCLERPMRRLGPLKR